MAELCGLICKAHTLTVGFSGLLLVGLGGLGGVCVVQMEIICKSRQAVGEWTEKIGIEARERKSGKNSVRGEIEAGPPWIRVGGFGIDALRQFGLGDTKKSVIRGRPNEQMEDGSR